MATSMASPRPLASGRARAARSRMRAFGERLHARARPVRRAGTAAAGTAREHCCGGVRVGRRRYGAASPRQPESGRSPARWPAAPHSGSPATRSATLDQQPLRILRVRRTDHPGESAVAVVGDDDLAVVGLEVQAPQRDDRSGRAGPSHQRQREAPQARSTGGWNRAARRDRVSTTSTPAARSSVQTPGERVGAVALVDRVGDEQHLQLRQRARRRSSRASVSSCGQRGAAAGSPPRPEQRVVEHDEVRAHRAPP